jgi:ParB-like chromosome segregation protein Spo0J
MASAVNPEPRNVRKRVASLRVSPENLQLYRCASDDPDVDALAESIRKNGLREPLVVTADRYIVSGHRRHAAL